MALIKVDVVSTERSIFSGEARFVEVPGTAGELGVLPGHTPLLTGIRPGTVRIEAADGSQTFLYIAGGFVEIQPDRVTILADTAMRADSLDQARAERAREQAKALLEQQSDDIDYAKAQAELAEAVAQLQAIKRMRKQNQAG
ncbi:F0F1 ATP synthase subunit epsilon [Pandoraea nosoerga]|uniref:ATP synthase epsilon chain n=1 Tax=Pandoraea nosoerga TaxID=2508296 RepID=A0A5E4SS85_9BURK|nr:MULTISPECIES: F0F1 ATP synthase subunit epsilon [Pandoraea]MBN4666458.1 F0F1 ATP synthase subunit epsilon [Pandoraea nosoerga]MBN4677598.1 F0F1 ATP synthase subunit epsilon [Pandoraea nosoerga]MBN4682520.1 F0F1 ATP synthase subunit epsilon [Pandoraea nosoerga]MBN4745618.1 F0F1 ATP synthase subunit epsilon [Pandoraea nosoerga]VVD78600.1 F0F1 ATP synthase subunit epsilon [Pandoraea nosoerga]